MSFVGKIFLTLTLTVLLVPGLVMDIGVPGVLPVRWFWSLLEVYWLFKIIIFLWSKEPKFKGFWEQFFRLSDSQIVSFLPKLLVIGLWLDGFRLGIGLGFFGTTVFPSLDVINPSWWSLLAVTLFTALALAGLPSGRRLIFLGLLGLIIHQVLLWTVKDIFTARYQLIIFLVLALTCSGKIKLRLGLAVLVLGFWGAERWLLEQDFYWHSYNLVWADPKNNELTVSMEKFMNQAAIMIGGRWGLGLEYWSKLELLRNGPVAANTLAYLVVWLGINGTGIYIVGLSFFVSIMVFMVQKEFLGWLTVSAWAVLCLMTLNILMNVFVPFGILGPYDPIGLPFVGSGQVGVVFLIFTYLIMAQRKIFKSTPKTTAESS